MNETSRDRSSPDLARGGMLTARLVALATVPVCSTTLALTCFVVFADPTQTVLWVTCTLVLGLTGVWTVAWARHVAGVIRTPIDEMSEALAAGRPLRPGASLHRRADWEVRRLYTEVMALQASAALADEDNTVTEADVQTIVRCLDRIGTSESAGDAAECTGALAPVGAAFRALVERLARHEHRVGRVLESILADAESIGTDAGTTASAREQAFLTLLEVAVAVKELRGSVTAILGEIDRADPTQPAGRRVRGIVERLGGRLDDLLDTIASVSSGLEAQATDGRRIVSRSRSVASLAADGAADVARWPTPETTPPDSPTPVPGTGDPPLYSETRPEPHEAST